MLDNETEVVETDIVEGSSEPDVQTGADAQEHDAPEKDAWDLDIEELVNAEFDDDAMKGEHKGLPPYQEVLKHVPENARKLVQNLRVSYTRKTQELAAERKELVKLREQIAKEREMLLQNPLFNQSANESDENEIDIWTEEGLQKSIEKQAQEQLKRILEPMREQAIREQRRAALANFKAQHPDLDDIKIDVAEVLKQRPELNLEDAYWIVKAKKNSQRVLADKEHQRSVQRKVSGGMGRNNSIGAKPKFADAWEAYQWHKSQKSK